MTFDEGMHSSSANGDYYYMIKADIASVKALAKFKMDLFLRK